MPGENRTWDLCGLLTIKRPWNSVQHEDFFNNNWWSQQQRPNMQNATNLDGIIIALGASVRCSLLLKDSFRAVGEQRYDGIARYERASKRLEP